MKKLLIFSAIALSTCFGNFAHAQLNVSINIGNLPVWGPVGYDNAQYYYIPDANAYYDVAHRTFMYQQGPRWVSGASLPGQYRNFDLYGAHKVVINEPSPWLHNDKYRTQYAQFRGKHDQVAIRDSHDQKYFQNPGHPQHQQWTKQHGNDHHDDNAHHGNDHR